MMEQNPFPEERKKREGRQAPEPKKREEGRQASEPQPLHWHPESPKLVKFRSAKNHEKNPI